ncbi:MAG: AarF/ABC1/UbiB kinase family protein [Chloroflexi bacterium]|nr:AarF/ABC1/UbiB kinase family protein [Chloroflexota bacterium]
MRNRIIATQRRKEGRHFGRYRQITSVLIKYRLDELIRTLGLERFLPFRWVPPGNPWRKEVYSKSQRTRMALEELGTTFVKMGQILSTRSDVLPSDFIQELTKLQASLAPIPLEMVERVINDELGRPAGELFASFEPKPLGVASIGQAHAATLTDGTEVVVKVQKPGVKEQVTEDLEIMRQMAVSAARHGEGWQQYNLTGLVEEIADTLTGELDYIREGHSAEHFARFFQDDPRVHIPKVFWNCTTPRVITLERIRGISTLDVAALDEAKFDRKELAQRSAGLWVKMVFENTIFHADPHPGNLFIESDGRLGLVDFGMIGLVDDEVRGYLVSTVKAMLDRDVDLLIDSLVDLGAITPAGSKESLRKDLKHIMGHYPLLTEDLNLTSNMGELFAVVRRNHVQLPGNTFLLLKTMTMAQGLGQRLDPDFDFFALLAPSADSILKKRYQPSAILRRLPSTVAELALFGIGLPNRLVRIVKSIERGELTIRADVSGVERHLEHLERLVNKAIIGLIVAAVILALAIAFLAYKMSG